VAEIHKWSTSATLNQANPPDNWKEGMTRAQVNDTGRETHAALRRWYNDAEWIQLHDGQGGANVVTRESTSSVRVAATPNPPAVADYPIDCRVRITHTASAAVEANVTAAALSGSDLIVTVDSILIAADANAIRRYISKGTRSASFRATGLGAGLIPLWDNLGTAAFKNEGPGSGLNADLLDGQTGSYYEGLASTATARFNLLLNGAMLLWQRGTTIDNTLQYQAVDGGYVADGWKFLVNSGAANIVKIERDTDVPAGFTRSMKVTAISPSAGPASEKFAFCQMLEQSDSAPALGGTKVVSVSFWMKTNAGPSTLTRFKAAVLCWPSTPDAPNADPITTWGAEGVDPTLSGAWVYEGVSSLITLGTTWTEYKLENVAIDTANAANLALLIFSDDTSYVGGGTPDIIWLTGARLEIGATATAFTHKSIAEEFARALRYFWKSFPETTRPQQNIGVSGALLGRGADGGFTETSVDVRLTPPMLKDPTIVTYNPSAANANWSDGNAPTVVNKQTSGFGITETAGVGQSQIHATAEAVL